MDKKERIVGFDILKILASIMIVVLHYNQYSKNLMIETAQSRGLFLSSNLIEAFCICGVNLFVIITCYNSIKAEKTNLKEGLSKAIFIWVQTIITTIPLAIVLLAFGFAKLDFNMILCLFPFSARAYWFVTKFICFSLILPLLNRSVKILSNQSLKYLALLLIAFYCVLPTFFEIFGWNEVRDGYTLVWFITLYYFTAWLIRCDIIKKIPTWINGCGYVLSSLLIFLSVIVLEKIDGALPIGENYIIQNYSSIPVVVQSFSLVFLFSKIKFNKMKKIIVILSSGSLMSYILHMHPLLKQIYTTMSIQQFYPKTIILYIILCFVISILVFFIGVIVYQLLKKVIVKITEKIMDFIENVIKKINILKE